MGQKVHPLGLRLGISQPHRTVWCTSPKNYGRFILEDRQLRLAVREIAELRQIVDASRSLGGRKSFANASERKSNGNQSADSALARGDGAVPKSGGGRAKARLRRSTILAAARSAARIARTGNTARGTGVSRGTRGTGVSRGTRGTGVSRGTRGTGVSRGTRGTGVSRDNSRSALARNRGSVKVHGLKSLQRQQAARLKPKAVVSTMFHTSHWRHHIREEHPVEISDIVIHRRRLYHRQDPSALALDVIELYVHTTRPVQLIHGTNTIELLQSVIDYQQRLERVVRALRPADGPRVRVLLNVFQVAEPEKSAQILAQRLVAKLEKREKFRPSLKRILREAQDVGIDGVKIQIAGRLNGAEIARTEWVRRGSVPLQTLRANLDYASLSAKTTYGLLGIKVWTYRQGAANLI
jgi:ribosomal protein S3